MAIIRSRWRGALLGVFLLLRTEAPVLAEVGTTPAFEQAVAHLREATKGQSAGIAVLVARDGKVLLEEGFGYADVSKKQKVTPETKFRIGSVTKQFTAAAILRLAEQKKLSLDDPLDKYFPGFAYGGEIDLREMLTHTSGIHSYTDKPEFSGRAGQRIEPAALIAWFRDDPADFAPGAGFHYSNSAYFLLGEIVGQVSGRPFADYLRAELLEPLGMKDTGAYDSAAPPPHAAIGYAFADGLLEPAAEWDMSWTGGAGSLYSTVRDLFRWNEALFNGRVIGKASFEAATTPVQLPAGVDGMRYGYGLVMFEVKGLPAIGHGGGFPGWSSELDRLPAQRVTVVALSNALPSHPGLVTGQVARTLAEIAVADEIAQRPPPVEGAPVDAKVLEAYAGRYDYRDAVMTVTVEGEGLFAQLTGQPKFRIFPKGPDEFFWKVADAQVTFMRNEKGEVVAARHNQGGNVFTARRLDGATLELTPEQLDAWVGRYQYGPSAVMTVTRDGQQLLAQLTGQPRFPIFPRSESEFEWRIVEARVRFVKGEDGKVIKAVHTQNGVTFDAPRIE